MRSVVMAAALSLALSWTSGATLLTLTGVNGEAAGGEYIGPYYVAVNGGVAQAMACDTLYTTIGIGQTWNANQLVWTELTDGEQPQYGVAYWLTDSILHTPAPHAAAQWALWNLFAPASPLPGDSPAMLAWAYAQYAANPDWAGYSGLAVWRPDPLQSSQEFLALSNSDTPEMGTLAYLGSGLLMVLLPSLRRGFKL